MKEHDIRPHEIFEEYLRLAEQDTKTFFADAARNDIPCPSCGATGGHSFDKSGFSYAECSQCLTLFVTPRPERAAFEKYYRDSPSTRYWATTFYKETEAARSEKIWKPKAALIKAKMSAFPDISEIVDIGGGYGTFAEEIRRIGDWNLVVIEPSLHLAAVCRQKGFAVIERFLEEVRTDDFSDAQRCFVSFELFEHLYDPAAFLSRLHRLMKFGDAFIFTTLSGTGVDIQVLWKHSKAVSPPHHLNFFNPSSVRRLLERSGFETVEITTPGELDIDIMENSVHHITDRFWKSFFLFATEGDKVDFQNFLSSHLLSSHMMVTCRKAA